ncbi:host attachment protein [Pseudoxanthomonas sp. SGNA-20]|jgi:Protein required for attachment to host cells|uniref:Protein required for attachment to host cells n=1 Tax=Pseudoxanthomonas taiwanensis J19 TaxID=935569 RepID=A0A562DN44_9GAMM|nr:MULTISPECIES: host attachment family protein [Pseudoxanthomonas]RRN54566.1 host attachment protein [Pseudoxanthomonas sp. SGNA-20]RRN79332.1 host attachment protein [Pseudoxanthomonas sp. SGD-10]TWH10913.1 protein required for attachment to host cells [Pseudoxanthomonas taiwanensis J19]
MRRIPRGAWVLVADGASARLFTNVGEKGQLVLHQEAAIALDPKEGEMPAILPPEVGAKEAEEAGFARELARRLNEHALNGRFQHLVLAADPTTLGYMRPLLHEEVRSRLLAEVAKNYTNLRREQIEQALAPDF